MLNTKYLLVYKYKMVTENLFQEEKKPKYNKCEAVKVHFCYYSYFIDV